jgi:hypothetical protein
MGLFLSLSLSLSLSLFLCVCLPLLLPLWIGAQMPRVWLDYCDFLSAQKYVTRVRHVVRPTAPSERTHTHTDRAKGTRAQTPTYTKEEK